MLFYLLTFLHLHLHLDLSVQGSDSKKFKTSEVTVPGGRFLVVSGLAELYRSSTLALSNSPAVMSCGG